MSDMKAFPQKHPNERLHLASLEDFMEWLENEKGIDVGALMREYNESLNQLQRDIDYLVEKGLGEKFTGEINL